MGTGDGRQRADVLIANYSSRQPADEDGRHTRTGDRAGVRGEVGESGGGRHGHSASGVDAHLRAEDLDALRARDEDVLQPGDLYAVCPETDDVATGLERDAVRADEDHAGARLQTDGRRTDLRAARRELEGL